MNFRAGINSVRRNSRVRWLALVSAVCLLLGNIATTLHVAYMHASEEHGHVDEDLAIHSQHHHEHNAANPHTHASHAGADSTESEHHDTDDHGEKARIAASHARCAEYAAIVPIHPAGIEVDEHLLHTVYAVDEGEYGRLLSESPPSLRAPPAA